MSLQETKTISTDELYTNSDAYYSQHENVEACYDGPEDPDDLPCEQVDCGNCPFGEVCANSK